MSNGESERARCKSAALWILQQPTVLRFVSPRGCKLAQHVTGTSHVRAPVLQLKKHRGYGCTVVHS